MKAPKNRSFLSGRPLPDNVYRSNKWNAGDRSYRYRYPDGSFKKIEAYSEDDIVRMAEEANEAAKLVASEIKSNKKEDRAFDDFSLGRWLEQFRSEFEDQKKGRCSVEYVSSRLGAVQTHLEPILHEAVRCLTKQRLQSCWREMSYHTQKNLRSTLRRFVQHLIDHDVAPLLEGRNPFWTEANGGFQFKEEPIERDRGTMSMELFLKIQEIAFSKGYHFLIDAMDISFLTFFRITDVITLRFDEHVKDNVLSKLISKSEGRKKSKPTIHSYDLSKHKDLKEVISRSKLRSDIAWKCPFIIHHSFTRYYTTKKKTHPNQVTRFYLNDCLNECMDEIQEMKNVPVKNRPSFHEIRALRLAVDKNAKRALAEISEDMAHTDTKVTERSYDTHTKYKQRAIEFVPQLKKSRTY